MKQKKLLSGLIVVFIIAFFSNIFSEETLSPGKSKEIIEKIRANASQFYKENRGIEYLRSEVMKEYDPSDDKLLSTSNLLMVRKEYFYETQEYIVKKFEKDGKEMDTSEYKERPGPPSYPVFDEKGADRYNTAVDGYETVEGKRCYKIKIIPKEETARHQRGYYYYNVQDLSIEMIDITLGELPFPLKEFSYRGIFNHKDGFVGEYTMSMRIKIPIVMDKRFIFTGRTIEAKLMKY